MNNCVTFYWIKKKKVSDFEEDTRLLCIFFYSLCTLSLWYIVLYNIYALNIFEMHKKLFKFPIWYYEIAKHLKYC